MTIYNDEEYGYGLPESMVEEPTEEEIEQEMNRQLEAWREEYTAVYVTEIEDIQIVWRGLSRSEYRKVMESYEDEHERAEYVCRICVLNPIIDDWSNDIYAGVPDVLTQNILRESGFSNDSTKIDELMEQYDAEMRSFDNQVSCIIKEAFQDIPLEEIENWQIEKTLWYYSRAKWTLQQFRGITLEKEEQVPGVPM